MEMGNHVGASQYIEYADKVSRFAQEGKPGFLTCCRKKERKQQSSSSVGKTSSVGERWLKSPITKHVLSLEVDGQQLQKTTPGFTPVSY